MTRRAREIAVLDDYIQEALFPPARNWPVYEARYRSCCRWAAKEIRCRLVRKRTVPVLDILEEFEHTMDVLVKYYGVVDLRNPFCRCDSPDFGFAAARDTAEAIASLYL